MIDHKHEARICPRCACEFVCKANRIHQCDCTRVRLSLETVEYIRQRYDDCLCFGCLEVLESVISGRTDIPRQRP